MAEITDEEGQHESQTEACSVTTKLIVTATSHAGVKEEVQLHHALLKVTLHDS